MDAVPKGEPVLVFNLIGGSVRCANRTMDPWMDGDLCWQHLPKRPSNERIKKLLKQRNKK